jgi:hypothetical protein
MKKVLLIAAVAGFVMASCKKDYTCVCTDNAGTDPAYEYKYPKAKKKDAEASCKTQNDAWTIVDYSCKLK